jgi:dTDP-4-amino-4,6-dideoxygalactose transaminase
MKTEKRDALDDYLTTTWIGIYIYYPVPLHLQKCFEYLGHKKGDFPVAERLCETVLALPMFPELTADEVDFVCEKIKEFYQK